MSEVSDARAQKKKDEDPQVDRSREDYAKKYLYSRVMLNLL